MHVSMRSLLAVAILATGGLAYTAVYADDMVSFATGGYAAGLRTMDKDNKGFLVDKDFVSADPSAIAFATAAYSRGLRTNDMFKKIDADGDGKITREEFVNYHLKIFGMLDVKKTKMIGVADFIVNK